MGLFSWLSSSKPEEVSHPTLEPEDQRASVSFSGMLNEALTSSYSVTGDSALKISAYWACIRILSQTGAIPPLHVFMKDKDGTISRNDEYPVYTLLHDRPNEFMTPFIWKQTMITNLFMHGNAYARIYRKGATPMALVPLASNTVTPKVKGMSLFYEITSENNKKTTVPARDMIHFKLFSTDGILGKDPLKVAADMLYGAKAVQEFSNKFFGNGANISGVIKHPGKLSDKAYKNLEQSWKNKYTGIANSGKPAILEEGMDYTPISVSPEQQQLLQSKEFAVEDISRFFGVPSHMINSLNKATLNNIEHLSIQFVRYTLQPLFENIEEELTSKLVAEKDKSNTYIQHDIDELLRGDMKARAEYYRTGINFGYLKINEVRKKEQLNPVEGGDEVLIQANMASLNHVLKNGPDNSAPDTKNIDQQ